MSAASEIEVLESEIDRFCENRDWGRFHNGKDLAAAISIEAAELQEAFLWKSPDDVPEGKVREELADVFIYAFRMASRYGFDVGEIVRKKLSVNALKYPVEKCRGTATKYTDLK